MTNALRPAVSTAALFAAMTAAPTYAQVSAASDASGAEVTLEQVVVTARRQDENLQEVPQTVNAISGAALQELSIQKFEDIETLVPGLNLSTDTVGFPIASMRGVSFVQNGAPPTIAFYVNDAPVYINYLFDSLFDIGQVEVLKGPQGTTRGISAPSGAITVTSRRADTSAYGAFVEASFTDQDGRNVQGAFNAPIISDVLALRLSGTYQETNAGGVTSIHNDQSPESELKAFRASVTYTPNDNLTAYLTWDRHTQYNNTFQAVTGAGPGDFSIGDTFFPASENPPLRSEDRRSVQDTRNYRRTIRDLATANVEASVFGQRISYVGSYYYDKSYTHEENDTGNVLPGVGIVDGYDAGIAEATTHELRIASDGPDRFFDYVIGGFYSKLTQEIDRGLAVSILTPGAFGPTPVPDVAAFDSSYQIPVLFDYDDNQDQTAIFGSVTLHLGSKTELSGGLRHLKLTGDAATIAGAAAGLVSLPAMGLSPATRCDAVFPGAVAASNPGDCVLAAGAAAPSSSQLTEDANIYNVSLSYRLTPDMMLYATTGTAFRPATTTAGGNLVTIGNSSNPELRSLVFHPSEESRSYEVGIKTTWFDGRARVNAAVFRQDYDDLVIIVPNINVLNSITGSVSTQQLYQSVGAAVQGLELSTDFLVTPDWKASLQWTYADGDVTDGSIPCNTFGPNGEPTFNTEGVISLCPPSGSTSRDPLWNLTLQTEYTRPVTDKMDGFVRLIGTLYPENDRVRPGFVVDGYSLVNLYAGVRSGNGAWEVAVFGKNIFEAEEPLDVGATPLQINGQLGAFFPGLIHPTNYTTALMTPEREVGVTIRYAFGSR